MVFYAVLGLLLCFLVWFYYSNPARLAPLAALSLSQSMLLIFSSLLVFAGLSLQQRCMIRPYCRSLGYYESFQLSVSNTLLNYLPLKTGILARGVYLKNRHKLDYSDYLVAAMAAQLLWIFIAGLCGLLPTVLLLLADRLPPAGALLAVLMASAVLLAVLFFFHGTTVVKYLPFSSLRNFFRLCSQSLKVWQADRSALAVCSLASILLFVLFAVRLWLAFYLTGVNIDLWQIVFLQSCLALAFAFSLLPGNLGVREGALVGLAVLLGYSAETALLAALIDRAASLLPALVLGPYYLHHLSRKVLLH